MDDASEEDSDDLMPEIAYQETNDYKQFSDLDYSKYPTSFDDSGWPLFGEYDTLSVYHPVTGRPWYESPRIPRVQDEGTEYSYWFQIALEFSASLENRIGRLAWELMNFEPSEVSNNSGSHIWGHVKSTEGNLRYASELRNKLKPFLLNRSNTIEFCYLWGEYRRTIAGLHIVLPTKKHHQALK